MQLPRYTPQLTPPPTAADDFQIGTTDRVLTDIPSGEADQIPKSGRTGRATRQNHRFQAFPPLHGPALYECGDSVLYDQSTTGGKPLGVLQPCWDYYAMDSADQRRDQLRSPVIRNERGELDYVVEAEATACAEVDPRDRERSPWSRSEIAAVVPLHDDTELVGARIVFKPISGYTAESLRDYIACDLSRWRADGQDAELAALDPTRIDGAIVTVRNLDDHVEVLVETATPEQAKLALARANGRPSLPPRRAVEET